MKGSILIFHWLPRIICILAILFVSVFALDAFESGMNIWQQLRDFIIHLVPSFILLTFLLIAWKWELVGGIVFTLIGVIMTPIIYNHNRNFNDFSTAQSIHVVLMITFPFIVTGVLFIASHFIKKN